MTPDRLRQVASVLEVALELDPEGRQAYLASLGGEHAEVRREVLRHLADPEATVSARLHPVSATGEPPERLGPYRLGDWLGSGGMGSVYLAERDDEAYVHQVAVKVLRVPFPTEEMIHRFRSERQILASFDHPYIARLLDGGSTPDGCPYLVMEYIDGPPLPVYCDEQRFGIQQRVQLFRKVCQAVQYAHGRLVVHRDLKPSNVLVTGKGEPKLLDFGIAKLLEPESFPLTVEVTTGVGPLTPMYASPEQLEGAAITTASDVYSLGILLYLLLTGDLPYRAEANTPGAYLKALSTSEPTLPSRGLERIEERFSEPLPTLRRQLAGDLDSIVMKALQLEPARRYQSAEQLEEDLRRHLEGVPVVARDGTALYRAGRFLRRHKEPVAAGAGFLGLAGAYAVTMARQATIVARERNAALAARDEAEDARRVAEEAQRKAEESALAEAQVSQFLVDLFESADPERVGPNLSVIDLVRRGVEKIQSERSLAPRTLSRLLGALGQALVSLCDYETSEVCFSSALQILEKEKKPNSDTAKVLLGYSRFLRATGRYRYGLELLSRAISIARSIPEGRELLGTCLNLQGAILTREGRFKEATSSFERASELLIPGDKYYPFCFSNLAAIKIQAEDYQGAGELISEYLTNLERGRGHGQKTMMIVFLSGFLFHKGQAEDSIKLAKLSQKMTAGLYQKSHVRYLRSLCHLSLSHLAAGAMDSSIRVASELQELVASLSGTVAEQGRFEVSRIYGLVRLVGSDYLDSVRWLTKCCDSGERYWVTSQNAALFMAFLGLAQVGARDLDSAEKNLLVSIDSFSKLEIKSHYRSAAHLGFARIHCVKEEPEKARDSFKEAIDAIREVPGNFVSHWVVDDYEAFLNDQGRPDEAKELRQWHNERLAAVPKIEIPDFIFEPEFLEDLD